MMKPCLDCGTPANSTRCPEHTRTFDRKKQQGRGNRRREYDRGDYKRGAALVRATATRCHVCGDGPKPDDPWQADHLIPLANEGGGGGPLVPAHRSCNIRRANQIRAGKPDPSLLIQRAARRGGGAPTRPHHTTNDRPTPTPPDKAA